MNNKWIIIIDSENLIIRLLIIMRFREFEASNLRIRAKKKKGNRAFSTLFLIMWLLNNEQCVLFEIPGNIKLELYENPADEKPRVQGNKRLRKQKKKQRDNLALMVIAGPASN